MTISPWYIGSWESVYFDIFHMDSKLQRFKIIIKPDLSDASLHLINMSEITSYDFLDSLEVYRDSFCEGYRICEDTLVYFWNNHFMTWGAYVGSTPTPFTKVVTAQRNEFFDSLSLCPTSGRFVYIQVRVCSTLGLIKSGIVVVDLF